eukprot:scaffold39580_cov62-Attheya_sp.AAC.4
MIANVSSGLAFVPFPAGPVYSATKAAIHSYTAALRPSLEGTSLKIVEIRNLITHLTQIITIATANVTPPRIIFPAFGSLPFERNARISHAAPAVKTNLGGSHDFGEECDEFCNHVMQRVQDGEQEVGFKFSEVGRLADRAVLDQMSAGMVNMMHVQPFQQE